MVELLKSQALLRRGFPHGFALRGGGASAGPFKSLNLGRTVGDDAAAVADNHARLAAALGYSQGALFEVSQVHGATVHRVAPGDEPELVRGVEADALLAPPGAGPVGIRVADCLPLLLAAPVSGAVAAVHAGWRGTAAGVVRASVEALAGRGARPADLLAVIFPHIRRCCFEVGEDVAAQLQACSLATDVVEAGGARPHVCLARIVAAQLEAAGLCADAVEDPGGCTHCDPERFFSHRRDGAPCGRHLAVITPRP